jgi:hypothetical protein
MVFCFIQKIFPGQHESYNIYFFCRTKRNFFSPKFNIRLYDKNSETDFFLQMFFLIQFQPLLKPI